ncbi:outer membrane beta-barrel protein [Aquabacter sp. CN5-332]|uniref:outer membrane protein n=1 Tax=Aquabacter sp. CN5-332 TaxID=3156608 RepID=UPI0032B41065
MSYCFRPALLLASALIAGLLLRTPAHAADPDVSAPGRAGDFTLEVPEIEDEGPLSGWYLRLDGGGSRVSEGMAKFGPASRPYSGGGGWTVGGGIGYRVLPQLRLDVTADYISHNRVHEAAYLANVYWDLATWGKVTPYVGAGLGMGFISLSTRAPVGLISGLDRDDWQPAWALMAGVGWALTPDITLNMGYRYLNLGAPAFSTPSPAWALTLSKIDEQQFRIGLRYAFK